MLQVFAIFALHREKSCIKSVRSAVYLRAGSNGRATDPGFRCLDPLFPVLPLLELCSGRETLASSVP